MTQAGLSSWKISRAEPMDAPTMSRMKHTALFQIFSLFLVVVHGWHDLDNSEYDCWPMKNPDEQNMIDCAGLEMSWVVRPPEKVRSGEEFNVTYAVSASNAFYEMAVKNGILKHSEITDNASEAKRFCEENECPSEWKHATESNCCIYHANIHSCPMAFMKKGGICGPWVPDDGKLMTHTVSQAGKMSHQNWTTKVVLVQTGVTSMIAHVKVGRMHGALEAKTNVQSAQVCDDGVCDVDERCDTCPADCGPCPMTIGIKAAIGLPIALFSTGFILTVVWLQYQKRKMLWDESWIINLKEISTGSKFPPGIGSTVTIQQANGTSVPSLHDDSASGYIDSPDNKQGFIQSGIYDGRTVAIKRIRKKTFTLSKIVRKEVKQVRELDHPNLCKFIGGTVEVPNVTIVTEYCPKGSLFDVLYNDDIPLNWGFRLSFATDIARGMAYLHHHKIYHGRLQSTNCVIDDRWVCKIADHGLAVYRRDDFEDLTDAFIPRASRIHCAPEVIAGISSNMCPTVDVYSFSIILLEIATRSDPLPDNVDLAKVELTWRPSLPEIYTSKSDNDCPSQEEYAELIKKCWAHNSLLRPTFEQIKKMLEKMNPNKVSPVDMMMTLMEKYSKHLELIVSERTQDLLQEKQKTDSLLYSMLPRAVADNLRQGISSEAQSYANATVYFSDIVGFTQLSSASTPYQVVDFLNRLYTTFDDIIDNHDVYKVETIGDAYMVVSGVPNENGLNHVAEIASMALDLVSVCKSFVIPHKPDVRLKIRAGIHSGPVVAGVVGTKMPRYCLFGDTVNTASRMESTSEALKIQCSSSSSELLKEIGGYLLTCRGPQIVKGKGEMITWWLDGKEGDGSE
ncbi:atrial natriuretic peptide receptor 2-like [Amblyraja radiata]|uniref:atrial natriuretic peptide receptor 2-like n=1 Tax=Amblyraja radiata TaxID=386614 RepID=UPI001401EE18|nr:atrial natriuretic peptide receptor 2-like [Amblyraja radiata]